VNANVNGALVILNGNQVGTTPFSGQLNPGTYALVVRATGYQDWTTQLVMSGPQTLNVTLHPLNYQLVVNANVNGALVFLNGNQVGTTPFSGQLVPGTYSLLVRAPGYQDWMTQVPLSGPRTLTVTLQPMNYQLVVNANVNGALVFLNNNQVGTTPFSGQLTPGTYALLVRAPGYQDWTTQVAMSGPQTLAVVLQPLNYQLSVNANVPGALVYLNDNQAGTTPFVAQIAPGSYSIVVTAPGYQDWTTQVTMNGPQTLNASLQPTMASLVFDLKPDNFTREMRDKRFAQVQVFVDNVQQKGFTLQVAPGPHQIRVVSWGMQSVITLTCEAGKSYTITPALSLAVQQ
jgi:DNA-binding transcriptional regulator of glucitol operon